MFDKLKLVPLILLIGCSAADKVTSVPNTFLEDRDIKAKIDRLPFDHAWVAPNFNRDNYTKFYFKPIRIDKLSTDHWYSNANVVIESKEEYLEAVQKTADYFLEQIKEKMNEQEGRPVELVDAAGPGVLVIEAALTEMQFGRPIAQAGALASPIPGTGIALSAVSEPHVSFAARITDGESGELLGTFADRMFPPARVIDFNKLTVSSSVREVCQLWATTIAEIVKGDGKTPIKRQRFTLKPW